MTETNQIRRDAADACVEILDTDFFTALCEPARVELLRVLVIKGRSDIQSLAEEFPQDRSVIARHLKVMELNGLVRSQKVGRQHFFELDGPKIADKMSKINDVIQRIVPLCCP